MKATQINKIFEFKSKLEGENKALKEQISSMQVKLEIGQQEVTALKQELEQMRITRVEKSELVKEENTTQRREI
jgi:peptidoglycan hydrolase CwlO-like protein